MVYKKVILSKRKRMREINKEEKELREEFLKYLVFLVTSGLKTINLSEPICDFWIEKIKTMNLLKAVEDKEKK